MPELEQRTFQKRQVAYKIRISDILNGDFTKDDISAGYVRLNELNISRVNIVATIIDKSEGSNYASLVIDDGTGKISLRSFEHKDVFSKIDIGDIVLVVGRVRKFNSEMYILTEILKRINNIDWVVVRKLEIKNTEVLGNKIKNETNKLVEEIATKIGEDIYLIIKKLDRGEGAPIEDVINSSKNSEAENMINRLLASGDIFEIKPGKLKVLE